VEVSSAINEGMTARTPEIAIAPTSARRTPVQRRSRERVERILQAAEELVVAGGIGTLSTRALAHHAGLPVGSVYTYFADRDAIIAALIERHVADMDRLLIEEIASLEALSIRALVESVVASFRQGYVMRPSFVVLWFQGRLSGEIVAAVRAHNQALAARVQALATEAGVLNASVEPSVLSFAAEMIDAFLALAYRDTLAGDDQIVREGCELMIRYLEPLATPEGIDGIPAAQLEKAIDDWRQA
jgi:AcrR family transcriptional regulator